MSAGSARSASTRRGDQQRRTPAGGEPRRLDTEARAGQLIDVAKRLFAQRAYDEVKVEDVATAAGVSEALVYHYFQTKRELYVAVIRAASKDMAAAVEPDPDLPAQERLHAAIDAYLRYVESHAEGYRTLHEGGIGSDPEIRAIRRQANKRNVRRIVKAIAADAKPPKSLELAVRGWLGFMESACLSWLDSRNVPREELREIFAQVLVAAALTAWPDDARPPEARITT